MRREDSCERCEYPGEGHVRCPKCGAKIEAILVEEWEEGERTVHCPSCAAVIESVIEE